MAITLDGTTGLIVSGNTNTLAGVTVGQGAGALASNTAVGRLALASNSSGASNTAFGQQALTTVSTGTQNTAVGDGALYTNTGSYNTAVGGAALILNTTASNNTAVGYQAGYTNTGSFSTFIGYQAGYSQTTGNSNTCVGQATGYGLTIGTNNTFISAPAGSGSAGYYVTTGSKNTIIGVYNGNQGGLDIRTASNYVVLSDGDGNPLIATNSTRSVALNGAVPQTGTGITFPASQSASTDANTLDDYEEGTFTATMTPLTSGTITLSTATGGYTKVGRQVTVTGQFNTSAVSSPTGRLRIGGLPFTTASGTQFESRAVVGVVGGVAIIAIDSWVPSGGAFIDIYPTGTTNDTYASNIDASTSVYISATYFTT